MPEFEKRPPFPPFPPDKGCPTVGHQDVEVCVPVSVKPFAKVGEIQSCCLGKATIKADCDCDDHHAESKTACNFTISQKIRVEIPVEFGANATVGTPVAECLGTGTQDFFTCKQGCYHEHN